MRDVVGGARADARGERGRADVVQLVGVQRDREAGSPGRGEEWTDVGDVEDALLHERVDRLGELLPRDGREGGARRADEPPALVGVRRRERVRGEVRDRDVDRRLRLRPRDQPQLPQLLLRLQAVAALHLDRRGAELDGIADASP